MPAGIHDMACMNASTTGTGTITLNGAVGGFQTFSAAGVKDQETLSYAIQDSANTWEYGRGLYTSSGTTLTRGPIISSSGVGSAISMTANAQISIVILSEDINILNSVLHLNCGGI